MQILKWLSVFAVSLSLLSCGGKKEEGAADAPSTENPPIGVVDDTAGFYVRVYDEGKFPYYEHKSGSFSSECKIEKTQSSQDIVCIVDVMEGDLYFHGLKFQFNVPTDMCDYFTFRNYFYYNWESGYGPRTVAISKNITDTGAVASSTCVVDGVTNCNVHPEISDIDIDAGTVDCVYDRSDEDEDLPNCCFGAVNTTVTTNTDTDGDGTFDSTTVSDSTTDWGGDLNKCLSGPGSLDPDWPKTSEGFPVTRISYVEDTGLNESYSVTGALNVYGQRRNYVAANFYTTTVAHTHNGFVSATSSDLPYAIDPIDDRDGDLMYPGQDSFEFRCEDRAFEVYHRIRVYVREWNTYEAFLAYASSSGATEDPDVTGDETANCDYNTFSTECNDVVDWDDYLTDTLSGAGGCPLGTATAPYNTTAGNEACRRQYFPSEIPL